MPHAEDRGARAGPFQPWNEREGSNLRLDVWLWVGSAAAVLLTVLVESLVDSFSDRNASLPFVLGLLTIGMWHGALDSVEVVGQTRWIQSIKRLAWYLLLIAAAAGTLFLVPVFAISGFLLLTMVHFGAEDTEFLIRQKRDTSKIPYRFHDRALSGLAALGFARGLQVIGVTVAAHAHESGDFFRRVERVIGREATRFPWEYNSIASLILLASVAFTAVAAITLWHRRDVLRVWAAESVILVIAAIALNPEFFVGLYLLVWHAPRHLVMRFGDDASDQPGTESKRSAAFYSLLFLLPAWAAVGCLVWIGGEALERGIVRRESFHAVSFFAGLSAATVAVYVVVTLPHHLLQHGALIEPTARDRRASASPSRP